jgi:hypothetical protein
MGHGLPPAARLARVLETFFAFSNTGVTLATKLAASNCDSRAGPADQVMFLQASVWVSTTGVSEYSENGILLLLAQGKGVAEFFPIDTTA